MCSYAVLWVCEPQRLGWPTVLGAQSKTSIFIEAFKAVVHDQPWQREILMPVAHDDRVEVSADFGLGGVDLDAAPHDWSDGADDAVATLNSEIVAMGEKVAVSEHVEARVGLVRDHELDVLGPAEVPREVAVDAPVVAVEYGALETRFVGRAPVVADNAREKHFAKFGGHCVDAAGQCIREIIDRLPGCAVVGLGQFLMDVPGDHVTAEADNDTRIDLARAPHVVEAQVDRGIYELLRATLTDFRVELIDAADLGRIDYFPVVPIRPHGDWAAAVSAWATGPMDPGRWIGVVLGEAEDGALDFRRGVGLAL